MFNDLQTLCLVIVLAPLAGALLAGLGGGILGRAGAHTVTILGVLVATICSFVVFKQVIVDGMPPADFTVYEWLSSGNFSLQVGFLIDPLTVTMMSVVTFVSLMIHVYTIGYMHDDPGYTRFFSYISLFTFAMLMLVMANNFMQLFFGWEAVGVVSYLLIGFWYQRESAIFANLKAFLVNRVGDFGFLIGIAAVLMYFNSLDYADVFAGAPDLAGQQITLYGTEVWSVMTFICICLFIGAMGKSAQVPLHVWLPDSMEGPTPISALIHAATMVTAGIFMVARMSPLFEFSETALNFVMFIGAVTALFMGLLGLVQNDIKRVIAYSTLSQLGYMTVALGASAYAAAIFHLATHAFFKALLFLAAGSVIIGMHHEQDMRKMGGLYRYMPVTWICCFLGTLALIGFPGTSGFFSKDMIIEAVHLSTLPAAGFAYWSLVIGVIVTALYSFRLFFMTFHGSERMDRDTWEHIHESPAVVWVPLCALAIPSIFIGLFLVGPMLFENYFAGSILVQEQHNVLATLGEDYHGPWGLIVHSFTSPMILLCMATGIFLAWIGYLKQPDLPGKLAGWLKWPYRVLVNKYGFDAFNQIIFAGGARKLGALLWQIGDVKLIDGLVVNGTALTVRWFSGVIRHLQTGYLYHYAFAMIIGLVFLLVFFVHRIGFAGLTP
jgi:NADH-quinone oxidoreductase subunit L